MSGDTHRAEVTSAVIEARLADDRETHPFLQYYGLLSHQQNMLQDLVRTGTYQRAISENVADFRGKVVLDVGCGTGILSLFAAQAGARKVYAVEASDIADMAKKLVDANGWEDVITIVKGKVEDVELPEKVDVIVSEPLGFMLVHERMLESYIVARERFLKPMNALKNQQMFPTVGTIRALPFSDAQLYNDLLNKTQFWKMTNFFGVDMTPLEGHAVAQVFAQPVIGYFDPSILIARSEDMASHEIDFRTASVKGDLAEIVIPFRFRMSKTSLMHGIACWFDADFLGSQSHVNLNTSPFSPGTHWYQVRLMLGNPIAANCGQFVSGKMHMTVNAKFSYDIVINAQLDGTREQITSSNRIALHDPYYHYLSPATASSLAQVTNWTNGGVQGANISNKHGTVDGEDDDISSMSED